MVWVGEGEAEREREREREFDYEIGRINRQIKRTQYYI